ncbi:MAG: hypothetical protein ACRCYY_15950 [Trueperaceae bacterium]
MLKRGSHLLIGFLVLTACVVQAQNPFAAILGNAAGLEERLLYKKPAGPYTVTIDGTRLVREDNYFKLEVLENGKPVPSNSVVTLRMTPPQGVGTPSEFTAKHKGEGFIIDPLPFRGIGEWDDQDTWLVNLHIQTPRGEGATELGIQVYPVKQDAGFLFRTVNVAIPVVVLLAFMTVFVTRKVRLEQEQAAA